MSVVQKQWQEFEQRYRTAAEGVSQKCSQIPDLVGPERRSAHRDADDFLNEILVMIQRIQVEMRGWSFTEKQQYKALIQQFQGEHSRLKADLRKALQTPIKGTPHGDSRPDMNNGVHEDQRERLLDTHQRVYNMEASLQQSKMGIRESEQIGIAVVENLTVQKEQLTTIKGDLRETSDVMDKARFTLINMGRRVVTDKIIQAVIILIELGIIGFIVWFRFIKD